MKTTTLYHVWPLNNGFHISSDKDERNSNVRLEISLMNAKTFGDRNGFSVDQIVSLPNERQTFYCNSFAYLENDLVRTSIIGKGPFTASSMATGQLDVSF